MCKSLYCIEKFKVSLIHVLLKVNTSKKFHFTFFLYHFLSSSSVLRLWCIFPPRESVLQSMIPISASTATFLRFSCEHCLWSAGKFSSRMFNIPITSLFSAEHLTASFQVLGAPTKNWIRHSGKASKRAFIEGRREVRSVMGENVHKALMGRGKGSFISGQYSRFFPDSRLSPECLSVDAVTFPGLTV